MSNYNINAGAGSTPPTRVPEITRELQLISENLDRLETQISTLYERAAILCSPGRLNPPALIKEKNPMDAIGSPMAAGLHERALRIQDQTKRIGDLIDALEV